jgi:hypothetical protein
VSNLTPSDWDEYFHFVARDYTHGYSTRLQSRGFKWGIVPKYHAPLPVVGGESEGLRRKELLD